MLRPFGALIAVSIVHAIGQQPQLPPAISSGPPITLHINQPCDPASAFVEAVLRGPGDWDTARGERVTTGTVPGPQDFSIPTSVRRSQAATMADVIVYCRGYRFGVVRDIPLGSEAATRRNVDLTPLSTARMHGRVNLPQPQPAGFALQLHVEITDAVLRLVGHSGGYRGAAQMVPIVEMTVSADGAFEAQVPDFKQDPLVASAVWMFSAAGKVPFLIQPAWPIASSYPNEVILTARPVSR